MRNTRYIRSSEYPDGFDYYIEQVEHAAYTYGYELKSFTGTNLILVASQDSDMMPKIVASADNESSDRIFFVPDVTFPRLNGFELEYSDDFEHWVGMWMNAAKLCTYLESHPFEPGAYDYE